LALVQTKRMFVLHWEQIVSHVVAVSLLFILFQVWKLLAKNCFWILPLLCSTALTIGGYYLYLYKDSWIVQFALDKLLLFLS
jgi:hypothetical protein